MRAFFIGIGIAFITSTSAIFWGISHDVSALEAWKKEHVILDNKQFRIIRDDLSEIKEGQRQIINHLLKD